MIEKLKVERTANTITMSVYKVIKSAWTAMERSAERSSGGRNE